MGHDRKYGKVITEHGSIPDDEPVIVFRARDRFSPDVIAYYASLCEKASPEFHRNLVNGTLQAVLDWQRDNPGKVRAPDSAAHQGRMKEGRQ